MTGRRRFLAATAAGILGLLVPLAASSAPATPTAKPGIVLVHGAFANASGWERVITILQHDGYRVVAVDNPLLSLDGDIAATRRAVEALPGPLVLVGHSYGGAVITGAGAGNPRVKALVYIAAIAPDAGERVDAFFGRYPSPSGKALRMDSAGFLSVERGRFASLFAADLPAAEGAVLAATQKPTSAAAFAGVIGEAAWKTVPSWFLISTRDRALSPALERFYARRMGAHVREAEASHFVFLSQPRLVAGLIEEAAGATAR